MRHYFQTTRLSNSELAAAISAAKRQEDTVLALFQKYGSLSPSMAHRIYGMLLAVKPPPTSIRRAITVLTGEGKLTKTDMQVRGPWAHLEHVWRIAQPSGATL